MKNISKIILLVLGIALITLSVKSFAELPGPKAALEGAVYLDEAVILPENEGKMVIIYSNDLSIPRLAREMDREIAQERQGAKAYAYKVYTGAIYNEVTVAGIQQGGSLVAHEKLGPLVKDGVLTKEQVISTYTNSTALGSVLIYAIPGALLIFFGLRKPKKQAKAKEA